MFIVCSQVDGNSGRKLPFYTPGVKDVLRATQSITDHVRSQLRNEVHLRKLGPQGFSNYVKGMLHSSSRVLNLF